MISNPSAIHSIASSAACASASTGTGAVSETHRVVIHVRPHERVELQGAPHRPVGEAHLDADRAMPLLLAHAFELRLDSEGRGEIEAALAGGRWCDQLLACVRVSEFTRECLCVGHQDVASCGCTAVPRCFDARKP